MTAMGADSREAADVMVSLGGYLEAAGQLEAAETQIDGARVIYGKVAPESRALLRATSALGRIREAEGHYDEALALHRTALDALVARYGADSSEVQPALSDIGSTLFALGDYAGAAAAFGQSAEIVERLAAVDAATAFEARTGDIEDQAIARVAFLTI